MEFLGVRPLFYAPRARHPPAISEKRIHSRSPVEMKRNLRNAAKRYLPDPVLRRIQKGIRVGRLAKLRLEATIHPRRFLHDGLPQPELVFVRARDIRYIGGSPRSVFCVWGDRGRVLDGDWDIDPQLITDTSFYQSLEMRINLAIEWTQTPYFQRVVKEIDAGEVKWNCRDAREFEEKCKEWDRTFESIRDKGYGANMGDDAISVNIDRNGRLLLNDGLHRLVFCQLLGVPEVPVTIVVRHRKWHDFRREIYEFTRSGRHCPKGMVYAPLLHVDLQAVPFQHGHDRFEIIKDHVHGRRILDIGAHFGYFCHRFEDLGYECIAVEVHPDICYCLRKLRDAQGRTFRIVDESVFTFVERERPVVDTVLALSVFHHFIKDEYQYAKLKRMLSNLRTRVMIVEAHKSSERQMEGAFRNYECEEFLEFIQKHSGLTSAEKIGVTKDGRQLFRLR